MNTQSYNDAAGDVEAAVIENGSIQYCARHILQHYADGYKKEKKHVYSHLRTEDEHRSKLMKVINYIYLQHNAWQVPDINMFLTSQIEDTHSFEINDSRAR